MQYRYHCRALTHVSAGLTYTVQDARAELASCRTLGLMNKNSYEIQTEQFQAALRARATALYERAIVIKSEYKAALQQASYQLTNLGIDVPFCLLTIQVRLRAQRPEFAWRRSKYREGKKLRSLPCSRTRLSKYTNDMDHKIVLRTERELAKLRKIWKLSGKALRDTKHLLRLNEQAGVGGIRDITDHYPDIAPLAPAPTPSSTLAARRTWSSILKPGERPVFKEKDDFRY